MSEQPTTMNPAARGLCGATPCVCPRVETAHCDVPIGPIHWPIKTTPEQLAKDMELSPDPNRPPTYQSVRLESGTVIDAEALGKAIERENAILSCEAAKQRVDMRDYHRGFDDVPIRMLGVDPGVEVPNLNAVAHASGPDSTDALLFGQAYDRTKLRLFERRTVHLKPEHVDARLPEALMRAHPVHATPMFTGRVTVMRAFAGTKPPVPTGIVIDPVLLKAQQDANAEMHRAVCADGERNADHLRAGVSIHLGLHTSPDRPYRHRIEASSIREGLDKSQAARDAGEKRPIDVIVTPPKPQTQNTIEADAAYLRRMQDDDECVQLRAEWIDAFDEMLHSNRAERDARRAYRDAKRERRWARFWTWVQSWLP